MQTATRRTLIAAAALAAAGLFGSLPYHGSTQAQGIPTVHHDVALVDLGDTLLGGETSFDTTLYNDVLGAGGSEETLYNSLVASVREPDGTWAQLAVAADGTFSFAADGSYRLQLAADGGRPLELQLAAPHLDLAGSISGRYERAPVPAVGYRNEIVMLRRARIRG